MKKNTKKSRKNSKNDKSIYGILIVPLILAILSGIGITVMINTADGDVKVKINYSNEKVEFGAEGEYSEEIPTIEEIDGGGLFEEATSDNGIYYDKGTIEEVDTSSVEAFKRSTLGRCIIANNVFGAQCVSLARAFWWDYAGFDVSTCGTGVAKGMMNCADDNARDRFKVIWDLNEIQEGTWIVLDGSRTGHICMALTKSINGYVQCLGENQGGIPCEYGVGGAGTNIINLSLKNFIGGYTPVDYIVPEPEPEPTPIVPDTGLVKE